MKRTELKRGSKPLSRKAPAKRRRAVSPASAAQRAKVHEAPCLVCGGAWGVSEPAHLIDRSLTTVGQDDALAVVPLCRVDHEAYDGGLDLLPFLEPAYRAELAFAVFRVGLVTTYRRVTNRRDVGR